MCVWMDFEGGGKKVNRSMSHAEELKLLLYSQCSLYLNVSILKTLVDWLVYAEQDAEEDIKN